jgi:hypothetical protein
MLVGLEHYTGRRARGFGQGDPTTEVGARLDGIAWRLGRALTLAAFASMGATIGMVASNVVVMLVALLAAWVYWLILPNTNPHRQRRATAPARLASMPAQRATMAAPSAVRAESPLVQRAPVSSPVPEGRAWALNRGVYRLFTIRWFWLAFGLFVGGAGVFFLSTPPLRFHLVSGTLARYSYADTALRLVGDRTAYSFHPENFHPALPEQIPNGTSVRIWIVGSYPDVDAVQLLGQDGAPEATYSDDFFAHPAVQERETLLFAIAFTTIGAVSVLGSLCWPLFTRMSRRGRWRSWSSNAPG